MIVSTISKMFKYAFEKEYFETYWAFDLHGTIIKPNHKRNNINVEYYPYAKETLQLLTKRPDIKMILWTSSYPEELEQYLKIFKEDGIEFDAINRNPEISAKNGNFGYYEEKFYFNILFEDKAGFTPEYEWELVYVYLKTCEVLGHMPDPKWTTKY